MLISGGVSVKAVANLMEHTNAAPTLKVYTHALPGDTDGAARVLSGKVFGPPSKGDGHFLGNNAPESRADSATAGILL